MLKSPQTRSAKLNFRLNVPRYCWLLFFVTFLLSFCQSKALEFLPNEKFTVEKGGRKLHSEKQQKRRRKYPQKFLLFWSFRELVSLHDKTCKFDYRKFSWASGYILKTSEILNETRRYQRVPQDVVFFQLKHGKASSWNFFLYSKNKENKKFCGDS